LNGGASTILGAAAGIEPVRKSEEANMSKFFAKPLSPILQASLPGGGAALALILLLLTIPLV